MVVHKVALKAVPAGGEPTLGVTTIFRGRRGRCLDRLRLVGDGIL